MEHVRLKKQNHGATKIWISHVHLFGPMDAILHAGKVEALKGESHFGHQVSKYPFRIVLKIEILSQIIQGVESNRTVNLIVND